MTRAVYYLSLTSTKYSTKYFDVQEGEPLRFGNGIPHLFQEERQKFLSGSLFILQKCFYLPDKSNWVADHVVGSVPIECIRAATRVVLAMCLCIYIVTRNPQTGSGNDHSGILFIIWRSYKKSNSLRRFASLQEKICLHRSKK